MVLYISVQLMMCESFFLVEDVPYIYRSLSVPKLTFLCRREHVILIQSGRNRRLQKTLQTSISSPMNETSIDGKRVLTLSTLPKATQGSVISRIHQPFILVFKKILYLQIQFKWLHIKLIYWKNQLQVLFNYHNKFYPYKNSSNF